MMDSTNPNSIFAEYKKVIGQFKLPGIDVGAILESRRKDIEAIAEANTTALAGVQSLAQKQSEILHTTLTELQSLVSRFPSRKPSPQPTRAKWSSRHCRRRWWTCRNSRTRRTGRRRTASPWSRSV